MSNNKSRKLARLAGGHKIYQAASGASETYEEMQERIKFIKKVTGEKSRDLVVKKFIELAKKFNTDASTAILLSAKTGLSEEEVRRLMERCGYRFLAENGELRLFSEQQLFNLLSYERW